MYKLHFDNFLINEHDDDDEASIICFMSAGSSLTNLYLLTYFSS